MEDPSCEESIETWDDVQRCLTGRFTPLTDAAKESAYEIHVIGERNSGTKFITEELQKCFPRTDNGGIYRAHRDFIRSKHFFQNPIPGADFTRSIVVSIFCDPVKWTAAMREKPYHAPAHLDGFDPVTKEAIPMPWQTFVTKTWATKRSEFDLRIIREGRIAEMTKGETCIQGFALTEVVPCHYDNNGTNRSLNIPEERLWGYWTIYELRRDHTGRPFNDVLELRRDKIINHLLEVPLLFHLAGYAAVRYEDLLVFGTRALLEKVTMIMGLDGLPPNCAPALPQQERIGTREISDDFRSWVRSHVDMKTERLLGYVS